MHNLLHIAKHWAMEPDALQSLMAQTQQLGFMPPTGQPSSDASGTDAIAVIPIKGPITAQETILSQMFGGTALTTLQRTLEQALANDDVKAILLDIDSPGGVAVGPAEVAELIYHARQVKPIWSYIGRHGCSAAYWLASAAERVIAHRSALVGSVGVVTTIPVQERPDQQGYRGIEIVSSHAANKRPDPRSADGMQTIRAQLDAIEQQFIDALAMYRHVAVDTVKRDFGRGGIVIGAQALQAQMIDAVGNCNDAIQGLTALISPQSNQNQGETIMSKPKDKDTAIEATPLQKSDITADWLQQERPDVYNALQQAGIQHASETAKAAGIAEGKQQERERLLAIEAAALPGHEELVTAAKADPAMNAEKLALQIVAAERQKSSAFLDAAKATEAALPEIPVAVTPPPAAADQDIDPNAPLEERSKAMWQKDATLRAEFGDDFDAYVAFCQAQDNGQVRILKQQ